MKEYWKDNLGIELDILKRESGAPRRYDPQLYRVILESWIPDPSQIVSNLVPRYFSGAWDRPYDGYHWPPRLFQVL